MKYHINQFLFRDLHSLMIEEAFSIFLVNQILESDKAYKYSNKV